MASNPGAAEVWIDNVNRGVTPLTLELDNHRSHPVVFRKECHQDVACELTASVDVRRVVLDVVGGLIPVILDAATGKWRGIDRALAT